MQTGVLILPFHHAEMYVYAVLGEKLFELWTKNKEVDDKNRQATHKNNRMTEANRKMYNAKEKWEWGLSWYPYDIYVVVI